MKERRHDRDFQPGVHPGGRRGCGLDNPGGGGHCVPYEARDAAPWSRRKGPAQPIARHPTGCRTAAAHRLSHLEQEARSASGGAHRGHHG